MWNWFQIAILTFFSCRSLLGQLYLQSQGQFVVLSHFFYLFFFDILVSVWRNFAFANIFPLFVFLEEVTHFFGSETSEQTGHYLRDYMTVQTYESRRDRMWDVLFERASSVLIINPTRCDLWSWVVLVLDLIDGNQWKDQTTFCVGMMVVHSETIML